jgi:large subunit ribosomal protein L29
MNTEEIRAKANSELEQDLRTAQEELFRLRFQLATGRLTNTARMRQVRRDVARIKTIMRERQLAQQEAAR